MGNRRQKILIGSCLTISFAGHLLFLSAFGKLGALHFGMPVSVIEQVVVDLKTPPTPVKSTVAQEPDTNAVSPPSVEPNDIPTADQPAIVPAAETVAPESVPAAQPAKTDQPANLPPAVTEQRSVDKRKPVRPPKITTVVPDPPLRSAGEFLGSDHEKLVYRISLLGMPVGSAELEANNLKGEVRITLRVKSDAMLSTLYPVDDLIETRHVNGNFILTKIHQQEGSFRGDRGFTLFLRDKNVFWIDILSNRSLREPLPNSEVVDILSGLYFLRKRQLMVGTTETLHIFDSDTYAEVPVEILRRETVTLPAFRDVDALLVQPRLKTEGIFKRTGDVQIWLSDNQYKVPIKIVTSISLGRVTAELVSAESKPPANQVIK